MTFTNPDSEKTRSLMEQIARGDPQALAELLDRYRPLLQSFVAARLDPKLAARVDPSDVVQETQLALVQRLPDYLERQPMPFHLWVRKTAQERLVDLHRHHRGRQKRSVDRERHLPERSSLLLALPLLRHVPSPSQQLMARERNERIARAVNQLPEIDREILLLRHAEELPFEDISLLLEIEPAAARKRFGRALLRLQKLLTEQGLLE
jgi:RNA polymerase sigma-70 factor (ECF subfamily)